MKPDLDPRRDIRFFFLMVYMSIGSPLTSLWHATEFDEDFQKIPVNGENGYAISFEYRRDVFIWMLSRLLHENYIKLHKKGVFFSISIEEQIEAFRRAWPATEKPYPNHPDADFYLWFFDPACPAGVAWRMPDGSYQIAD